MLNKENLNNVFNTAKQENAAFVFVGIEAEGTKEIIAVPNQSFEAKQEFYNNAYTDELVYVMNSKVRITGITHGDSSNLNDLN